MKIIQKRVSINSQYLRDEGKGLSDLYHTHFHSMENEGDWRSIILAGSRIHTEKTIDCVLVGGRIGLASRRGFESLEDKVLVWVDNWRGRDSVLIYTLTAFAFLRAATVHSYKTSLKAKRKAAVRTLWLTFGTIPADKNVRAKVD